MKPTPFHCLPTFDTYGTYFSEKQVCKTRTGKDLWRHAFRQRSTQTAGLRTTTKKLLKVSAKTEVHRVPGFELKTACQNVNKKRKQIFSYKLIPFGSLSPLD